MLRKQIVSRRQRRRGAVVILFAFLLVPILGMVAIALEGGLMRDSRRRTFSAADAAALAGATELFRYYPKIVQLQVFDLGGAAASAALNAAAANGYPNDGTTNQVTVNVPPQSGPFSGQRGYIEVIITYNQPRYFSAIWGTRPTPIQARAVARGRWKDSGNGIIILDPTQKDSLDASGTGSTTVTGGAAVIVDSNNLEAGRGTGGGGTTASKFRITGGYTGNLVGSIETNTPPVPDPLRDLPVPPVPADGTMTVKNLGNGNKQYTLSPGRYTNLPVFNSGDTVILQQGGIIYVDGGGFKSTGADIKMDPSTSGGVMIYNNPNGTGPAQQLQITGNASGHVSLSPLTDGPYAGMIFFQNRNSAVPISISGNGDFKIYGTFYAANAQMQMGGQGNATIGSQYISRTLTLSGGGNLLIDYSVDLTARVREVLLVE